MRETSNADLRQSEMRHEAGQRDPVAWEEIRRAEIELKKTRLKMEIARLELRQAELENWLELARESEHSLSPVGAPNIVSTGSPRTDGRDTTKSSNWESLEVAAWERLAQNRCRSDFSTRLTTNATGNQETDTTAPSADVASTVNSAEHHHSKQKPDLSSSNLLIPLFSNAAEVEEPPSTTDQGPSTQETQEALAPSDLDPEPATVSSAEPLPDLQAEASSVGQPRTRSRRMGSAALSTAAHALVLLILALWNLQSQEPRDVVALSASAASETDSEELESVQIAAASEPTNPAQEAPAETPTEVDPLGELPAMPSLSEASALATTPMESFEEFLPAASDSSASLKSLTADTTSTVFCGVSSGGKRMCFLVDSSKSMDKGRFEAARTELLNTIDSLAEDKRFYVIFYNTEIAPMCLTSQVPEEYLAAATPENKRALRTWAMTVSLGRGAPPDDALRKAFELQPEVIFLLTDGEFSDRTEQLLAELNRKESLFESGQRNAIVHTIAFHSKAGVDRLKKIATIHGGSFRYVPPPE